MTDDKNLRDETDHLFELGARRRHTVSLTPEEQKEPPLTPQLQGLVSDFREIVREIRAVAEGLSREQFNWRPGSGRWSISDCFGHLNIVGSEQLPVIDFALREVRSRGWHSRGPFRSGIMGRWLIQTTEPPVRRRMRASENHIPPSDQLPDIVVPALLDLQDQLMERLIAANGLSLTRARVPAPGRRVLRLNLYALFVYLAAHERRHVEQAWRVRRDRMFPKSAPARSAGPVKGG
jgi:hypothetical protein